MGWFDRSSLSADAMQGVPDAELEAIPGEDVDHESLLDEARACAEEFKYKREGWSPDQPAQQLALPPDREMRQLLARAAVDALEPDIIILDEFQRFTSLLHDDNPGAELARALFDHGDARLLLLSATPFKMYTLPDEAEGDDHYDNFLQTVDFLAGAKRASIVRHNWDDYAVA